jgi:hypothetical protein
MTSRDSGAVTFVKLYPLEGDSAVAELKVGGEQWGELHLEDIKLDREGEDRLKGARVVLTIYPRLERQTTWRRLSRRRAGNWAPSAEPWGFLLDDLLEILGEARRWLLENERGREPLDEGTLTAAGAALSKASRDSKLRRSIAPPKGDEAP